ncbi:PaaI family thioesterase [Gammaproteobacteria bacterium]|nr:PaaI family thioesterase [Gammaproteobacteria bacterium]
MSKQIEEIFREAPPFLKILGFKEASISDDGSEYTCIFEPSVDLTHSNGTIVQGGFVAGMLDSAMAQFLIYLTQGKKIPLTLDMTTTFLLPCTPNSEVIAKSTIVKQGRSIAFTKAEMFQGYKLIATSSATNKLV